VKGHRLHPVRATRTRWWRRCGPADRPRRVHGELGWREKEEALEFFRDHSQILVSTEAGGEGRNLQFCRIVINYDLPEPCGSSSGIGRVHRLAQKYPVRVIIWRTRNDRRAYVLEILDMKIRMFELVVGEMEEILERGSRTARSRRDLPALVDGRTRRPQAAIQRARQHLLLARKNYQTQKEQQGWLYPTLQKENRDRLAEPPPVAPCRAGAPCGQRPPAGAPPPVLRPSGVPSSARGSNRSLPGRGRGRGDWEVELSPWLHAQVRRQRVRLVFDRAATLPKGCLDMAPGTHGRTKDPARRARGAAVRAAHRRWRTCPARPASGWRRCAVVAD